MSTAMKIVHLATTDLGGSYKAVERIHKGLILNGVDSAILLRTKLHEGSTGTEVINTPIKKLISKTKNLGNLILSKGEVISDYFGTDMSKHPQVREADVIILHWVNSFISYKNVKQLLALGKPVIWVAHDMWPYTGGCHCDRYCGKYETGCGKCPLIGSRTKKDVSYRNYKRKMHTFSAEYRKKKEPPLILVGPSRCSAECAQKSSIWQGNRITWIHNPIDYDQFHKIEEKKEIIRKKYGLQTDKKIILFGAVGALNNTAKGIQYLQDSLQYLDAEEYFLAVFGNREQERLETCLLETKYFGYIYSETEMTEIYNLADVFLAPSEQESFCYTVGEALACGTPVVGFRIGGIAEQVIHKENGFLAEYGKADELAEGIRYCCSHSMSTTPNPNSLLEIGRQYKELCAELLDQ